MWYTMIILIKAEVNFAFDSIKTILGRGSLLKDLMSMILRDREGVRGREGERERKE